MKTGAAYLVIILLLWGIADIVAMDPAVQTKPEEKPEDQRIKVRTELMEVRAVVTDRDGRIVENLAKDDFELLENGQPQEISFFSVSQVESERSESAAVKETGEPERATGQRPIKERLSEPPVRTTLLYVDSLHLSFTSLNSVKQALRRFINERLTEQDMVALATSGQTLGLAQQFTRNKQILNYAIEQIRLGPVRFESLFTPYLAADVLADREDGMRLAVEIVRQEQNTECPCSLMCSLAYNKALQILAEDSFSRRNTLSILKDVASQMTDLPGKRMIVIFSDGFSMRDIHGNIYDNEIQSVISRAVRSGVVIYSIDAKGLRPPPIIDASRRLINPNAFVGAETAIRLTDPSAVPAYGTTPDYTIVDARCPNDPPDPRCFSPYAGQLEATVNTFEHEMLDGLSSVAKETGGKMFTDTNDLSGALGRAFDANRFYYVLSYYLPVHSDNLAFREIKVRVRDHPEYSVRTARGFSLPDLAAKMEADSVKTPQQHLLRIMNEALPVTDLGVSARADFVEMEDDDKQVSLTVSFDGDRFEYREEGQHNIVELEILYVVYDSSGKQMEGTSALVEGRLTPDRLKQAQTHGFRFSRRLMLNPGVYQARIGVREVGTDRMGTATAWMEVPELAQDKLEMSSLILSNPLDRTPMDTEGMDVSELEQIRMVQSIPLFERGDFFDYSFRVYQGLQASERTDVEWMPELFREGRRIREGDWVPISIETGDLDSKGWFDVYGEVDISEFDSGVYELRVSVRDSRSDKTVQRATVFSVE